MAYILVTKLAIQGHAHLAQETQRELDIVQVVIKKLKNFLVIKESTALMKYLLVIISVRDFCHVESISVRRSAILMTACFAKKL